MAATSTAAPISSHNWEAFFCPGELPVAEQPAVKQLLEAQFTTSTEAIVPLVMEYLARKKSSEACPARADTSDFGVQTSALRFGSKGRAIFGSDMEALSKHLGFDLEFTTTVYFPRDSLLRMAGQPSKEGDQLCMQSFPDSLQISRMQVTNSARYRKRCASYFSGFLRWGGSGSSIDTHYDAAMKDYAAMHPTTAPLYAPHFFEGGNLFVVSHPLDQARNSVLIGEETFMIGLLNKRREKFFQKDNSVQTVAQFNQRVKEISAGLTEDQVFTTAKEMYMLGLLKFKKEEESENRNTEEITRDLYYPPKQGVPKTVRDKEIEAAKEEYLKTFLVLMTHCWDANDFKIPETQKGMVKAAVATFLAQKETMKLLYGEMFQTLHPTPRFAEVVVVPPFNFHIDMFMKPGPDGKIFLQDYGLCANLLKYILEHAKTFELTAQDIELLRGYLKTAEELAWRLEALASETEKVLKAAGFTVVPTPGLFYDAFKTKGLININLLNANTGFSKKTGRYYYIVGGITIGDKLGEVIMMVLEKFFKLHIEALDLHFVGKSHNGPSTVAVSRLDFKAATEWCSDQHAGVHCQSIETRVHSKPKL